MSEQNGPAAFTDYKVAQRVVGSSILVPREDHPTLFPARIRIDRHFPKTALVPQWRRKRKRAADDSDVCSAAVDELGRLHHAVAKHESVLYLIIDAQALHGRLRCSAVRCMTRIGDRNSADRRAEQSLHPEFLDLDGRSPRHPNNKAPYSVYKFAVGDCQTLPNKPAGIVDVRRKKDVEGSMIGKLGVETSG